MSDIFKQLIDRGYSSFRVPPTKSAKEAYQKRVEDSVGIKYFINAYVYDNAKLRIHEGHMVRSYSVEYEVQFSESEDGYFVNISPMCEEVEKVEQFFESFWNIYTELGIIDYYDKFNKMAFYTTTFVEN